MEMRAVKHLDPVVGVDLHAVIVAPSPTPVFVPHPHIGFILDLREYITAAMAVIGSIAMTIVEEKVVDYLQDHPDVVKDLGDAAQWAGNKLDDAESNALVAKAMTLGSDAANMGGDLARIAGDMANATGAGVGMGGGGRPIFVNGFMRTTAGTHTYHVPGLHFPLGESFAPVPSEEPVPPEPSNDAESYMGSKTVLANNDPMSFMALPAMSCWSIGLEPPQHNGVHTQRTYPSMPSSFMLPIPVGRPVFVGGPPTMNMAALAVGLFKAFRGSEWAKKLADKLHLKPGFLRCNVLGADPVNMITGEVVMSQRDFLVSGRLPLVWGRHYASHDARRGAVGMGWQTPADIRLELKRHGGAVGAVAYFQDHVTAFDAMPGATGWPARIHDWQYGHALYRRDGRPVVRTAAGIEYEFDLPRGGWPAVEALFDDVTSIVPITRMADLHGNAWVFERGPEGDLMRITERTREAATGRVIECDAAVGQRRARGLPALLGALTLIEEGRSAHRLVGYEHDDADNLVAASNAMGQPRRFEYAQPHRMVRHTSARGVSFHYSYRQHEDGVWRVDHTWGDNGVLDYRFDYDIEHRETRVTNSLGHTTILQANERGLPLARIDPLGGITSYRYDACGRANAEIDPAGRTTAWEYDACGNLIKHTLPDGGRLLAEFNAENKPLSVTEPGGGQWRYEWDERGNLLMQSMPSQAGVRYEYDPCGQAVASIAPGGAVTRFEYDQRGHPAGVIDALGHRTQYTCDILGNLIQIVDALGHVTRYEYDRNGNLTRAIEPGGSETHCVYDADGNLLRHLDPAGNLTQQAYSALGHVLKRETPDGNVVEYCYDTEERLIGVVNKRGARYEMKRDALGRIVEEIDFWRQPRRYRYGPLGQLDRSIDPLGQEIVYVTDTVGRIVEKQVEDPRQPDGVRTEHFSYDRFGRLIVAASPDGRVEMRYDEAGRLVEERQDDFSITHRYDDAGRRIERCTNISVAGATIAHTVRYGYDARGEIDSIQIDGALPFRLERDPMGRVCVERLGDQLRRDYSYTPAGELARQILLADAGPVFATEYAYDPNREIKERCDSRLGMERFDYDRMGKLTAHLDPAGKLHRFLYDRAGDLLSTRVREDGRRGGDTWLREGEYAGCRYTFDRIGNLLRKQEEQQDLRLRWDGDGLLVEALSVRRAVAPEDGALRVHTRYAYDVFHRRTRKVSRIERAIRAPSGAAYWRAEGEHTHRFFWEGDALVGEIAYGDERARISLTGAADLSALPVERQLQASEWVNYPGTFRPLACTLSRYSSAVPDGIDDDPQQAEVSSPGISPRWESQYVFHTDLNGMPMRLTDRSGKLVWEGRCDAWGKVDPAGMRAEIEQPLRFQGQYYDPESGLHYNRFRYYDPAIGQFVSPDPIRMLGGIDPYAYGRNGLGWIDPLGLSGDLIHMVEHYFGYPDDPDIERRVRAAVKDYLLENRSLLKGKSNIAAALLHDGTFDVTHGGDQVGHPESMLLDKHGSAAKLIWSELQPCTTQYKLRAAGDEDRFMMAVEPCASKIDKQEPFNGKDKGLKQVLFFLPPGMASRARSSNETVLQSMRQDLVRKKPRLSDTSLEDFLWPSWYVR